MAGMLQSEVEIRDLSFYFSKDGFFYEEKALFQGTKKGSTGIKPLLGEGRHGVKVTTEFCSPHPRKRSASPGRRLSCRPSFSLLLKTEEH